MRRELRRRTLARSARSGDKCPVKDCAGTFAVYHTHCTDTSRIRYIGCDVCGFKPANNKQVLPLDYAPYRPRRPAA